MRKILLLLTVLSLCPALVLAGNSVTGDATLQTPSSQEVNPIMGPSDDYNPELQIQFPFQFSGGYPMSISSEGMYYYAIGYYYGFEKYELDGTFVEGLTMSFERPRSIMYNPDDGLFYVKPFGTDLYTIDVSTAQHTVVTTAFFVDGNACATLHNNLIYEHLAGDVYVHEIPSGTIIETLTGFTGYTYPITNNGDHLFTMESGGGLVHAWEFDGTHYQDFTLPYGEWSWSLSFCNNLMFTSDHDNGNWYGYTGVGGGPPPDTMFMASFEILSPYVPSINGDILFDVSVRNAGALNLPLYGEIIPTIGDCATGTRVPMGLNRMLAAMLPSGNTYTGSFFYHVPNVSGLNLSQAAIWFECGPAVGAWIDEDCDEFMFCNPWLRPGEITWGDNWYEMGEMENIPSTTDLNQNYPNPFNATTGISFDLAVPGEVSMDIFNIAGQKVATLANGYYDAGTHTLDWDASAQASGVYFYKLSTGDRVFTRRMTLLK